MERDQSALYSKNLDCNFNSHAHVERDSLTSSWPSFHLISTHTLTWSVTNLDDKRGQARIISTHTLTWSVTRLEKNPVLMQLISTHTLTWSVTLCFLKKKEHILISTHTLTWSVTDLIVVIFLSILFQLTRSRGA